MITYPYICIKCDKECEFEQSILTYKPKKKCPHCKKNGLKRTYDGDNHFIVQQDATTIAQQGERNFKALGRYGQDKFYHEREEKKERARQMMKENLPRGARMAERDMSIPKKRVKRREVFNARKTK